MQKIYTLLMLSIFCITKTYASDDLKKALFERLDKTYTQFLGRFDTRCKLPEDNDYFRKRTLEDYAGECNKLIATMEEINKKFEANFWGFKRYELEEDSRYATVKAWKART